MNTTRLAIGSLANTLKTLNRCIEVCTDGEKAYGAAAADVRSPTLKSVFRTYERQRAEYVSELQDAIDALGARHENKGTVRGTMRRAWTGARLKIEGRNDAVIVDECMKGEAAALNAYDPMLRVIEQLPQSVRALLIKQRFGIAAGLEEMKNRLAFPERSDAADLGTRRN